MGWLRPPSHRHSAALGPAEVRSTTDMGEGPGVTGLGEPGARVEVPAIGAYGLGYGVMGVPEHHERRVHGAGDACCAGTHVGAGVFGVAAAGQGGVACKEQSQGPQHGDGAAGHRPGQGEQECRGDRDASEEDGVHQASEVGEDRRDVQTA